MIAALKNMCQVFKRPKVLIEVSVDHMELAEDYLILGLNLAWNNETAEPIKVEEAHLRLFHQGYRKEPLKLHPQGHFARVPGQKLIKKIVGAKSFQLPAQNSHLECIRFFTREVLDLPEGKYPVEILSTVPGGTYLHETDVLITKRAKYRTSEAWVENENYA
jgi:hypothetical protein